MSTTPDYLNEAGTILMATASANLKREADTRHLAETHPVRQEIRAEAQRIADSLTRLAEISARQHPCCCHHAEEESPS